jgi:hypothetical protein
MTKAEWIEKLVEAKGTTMKLDAQNKATLRSMLSKEYDELEREAVREDSHNSPVEGYYETNPTDEAYA